MAMIFRGASTCAICNNILQPGEDICGFPPFVANIKDKIYLFNDAGCHTACVHNHPLGKKAMELSETSYSMRKNKVCWSSGQVITLMEDYFGLPILTSDDTETLFQYNFLTLDKRNIPSWKDKGHFIATVTKFITEDKWEDQSEEFQFWETPFKLLK